MGPAAAVFEELARAHLRHGSAERAPAGAGGWDRGRGPSVLLPFSPTGAQRRAMEDMVQMLASGRL